MITEASCENIFWGASGAVSVNITARLNGTVVGSHPDINGLIEAMRVAGEEFMAKDSGVKK